MNNSKLMSVVHQEKQTENTITVFKMSMLTTVLELFFFFLTYKKCWGEKNQSQEMDILTRFLNKCQSEATFEEGGTGLAQQSQRWLASQGDPRGTLMAVQNQLNVTGNCWEWYVCRPAFKLEPLMADGLLLGPVPGPLVLLDWLLARWYLSIIPFLWASSLMLHVDFKLTC